MIKISNISKTYHLKGRDVCALKNVSLNIEDGKVYGIIGYSGAGKSTLVRCLNLLETPDSGDISINDVNLVETIKKEIIVKEKNNEGKIINTSKEIDKTKYLSGKALRNLRKNIGMIFQHFNLLDRSTVFDNIAYTLRFSKKSKKEINDKVEELLDLVDLSDKAKSYPSQLSGGQKQRVAIARALANDPKILLSDEATSALDPEATKSILQLLKKLNHTLGITIVVITHEMDVVKEICDRVAVMENGEVVEEGSVYDIFAHSIKPITKKFVSSSINDEKINSILESNAVSFEKNGKIVKLTFDKNIVGESLISDISSKFNVKVNILLADVEIIDGNPLGTLVSKINGENEEVSNSIKYLKDSNVNVEVLYE